VITLTFNVSVLLVATLKSVLYCPLRGVSPLLIRLWLSLAPSWLYSSAIMFAGSGRLTGGLLATVKSVQYCTGFTVPYCTVSEFCMMCAGSGHLTGGLLPGLGGPVGQRPWQLARARRRGEGPRCALGLRMAHTPWQEPLLAPPASASPLLRIMSFGMLPRTCFHANGRVVRIAGVMRTFAACADFAAAPGAGGGGEGAWGQKHLPGRHS